MSLRFLDPLDYCDGDVCVAPMALRVSATQDGAMARRDAAIKRGTDIVLALAALALLAVPMLLAAAVIRLTSQGTRGVQPGAHRPERPPVPHAEIPHHAATGRCRPVPPGDAATIRE